jgi:hypothetical protein
MDVALHRRFPDADLRFSPTKTCRRSTICSIAFRSLSDSMGGARRTRGGSAEDASRWIRRLAAPWISPTCAAARESNFSVAAGQITGNGERLSVRGSRRIPALDEIRNPHNQGNVHLSDVASVSW